MSGPNPPGWEPEEPDAAGELRHGRQSVSEPGEELAPTEIDSHDELEPHDDSSEIAAADHTGQTDAYSQAYSAPESEHFITGPYVPADLRLYDYDGYDDSRAPITYNVPPACPGGSGSPTAVPRSAWVA